MLTSPLRSIHRANLEKKHDVILIAHTILKKITHLALRSSDSGVTPVGQSCDDGRGCGDESETSHLCAWGKG